MEIMPYIAFVLSMSILPICIYLQKDNDTDECDQLDPTNLDKAIGKACEFKPTEAEDNVVKPSNIVNRGAW